MISYHSNHDNRFSCILRNYNFYTNWNNKNNYTLKIKEDLSYNNSDLLYVFTDKNQISWLLYDIEEVNGYFFCTFKSWVRTVNKSTFKMFIRSIIKENICEISARRWIVVIFFSQYLVIQVIILFIFYTRLIKTFEES